MTISELLEKLSDDDKLTINGKVYIPVKTLNKLSKELKQKNEVHLAQQEIKYKQKYQALNTKYRTLYMKYKHQSNTHLKTRCKYIEIIHQLQCEIVNQASIEDLIKEVDRMREIEISL